MAEYVMQEMTMGDKDGKRIYYPRLVLRQQADTSLVAMRLSDHTTFSAAEVIGLLQALSDEMANLMSQGRSVKLDGIGTFTPALSLKKGKERETGEKDEVKRNAQSIRIGSIHFLPEKRLVSKTNRQCDLKRSTYKFRRSSQKYTPRQRLELLQKYLATHPYIRIAEYAYLTGLRRTAATLELKEWSKQPESGIDFSGRGTHKVYIKKLL